MRVVRCTLPEGGAITVQGLDFGRTFRGGDLVDLDALAAPASGARAAQSWGDALGHHADEAFTPDVDAQLDATIPARPEPGEMTGPLGPAVRPLAAPANEE